jgi:hypothetical protein
MDKTKVTKNIFGSKPGGTRKIGRPRLRRLEDAENDVTELKMKRFRGRQTTEKNRH